MATLIRTKGEDQELSLPKKNQLEYLQNLVGGYIEVVGSTQQGHSIVLNEEGKLDRLAPNYKATVLHWHCSDVLRGDVLIVKTNELN
tara:strand:+ start:6890 stop:7150 length:261 start_codon:yes stop_codon:yes gene_type:complete